MFFVSQPEHQEPEVPLQKPVQALYDPPHQHRYLPVYGPKEQGLHYARYEWSFHPFADILRIPANKLKLFEGEYVEGVTYFTTRKRVLLPDDQGTFVLRHEDRHCKLPFMLEHENHAWDRYEDM